jgi:hypothetical protein
MTDHDPTLERIDDRLVDLASACSSMDGKLDAVRLEQAKQGERWTQHAVQHGAIDKRLDGIEGREREDATGRVTPPRRSDSDSPRRRGVDMAIVAKIAAGIGVAIAVALSAWTSGNSATAEDVHAVATQAARAAAAVVVESAAVEVREAIREGLTDTAGEVP